ncbi:hypothetical protein V1289_008556 [Bradyrhizobium sp. AZCC 2289]
MVPVARLAAADEAGQGCLATKSQVLRGVDSNV